MTKRQPRGIPVGGQFAESARAEADVAAPTSRDVAHLADDISGGRLGDLPYRVADISDETARRNPRYEGMTFDEAFTTTYERAADLIDEHGDDAEAAAAREQAEALSHIADLYGVDEVLPKNPNSNDDYWRDPDDVVSAWYVDRNGDVPAISWSGIGDTPTLTRGTEDARAAADRFDRAREDVLAVGELRQIRNGTKTPWSFLKPSASQAKALSDTRDMSIPRLRDAANGHMRLSRARKTMRGYSRLDDAGIEEKVRSGYVKDGAVRLSVHGKAQDVWYDKAMHDAGEYADAHTDEEMQERVDRQIAAVHRARQVIEADKNEAYDAKVIREASRIAFFEKSQGYPGGFTIPEHEEGSWSESFVIDGKIRRREVPALPGAEELDPQTFDRRHSSDPGRTLDDLVRRYSGR